MEDYETTDYEYHFIFKSGEALLHRSADLGQRRWGSYAFSFFALHVTNSQQISKVFSTGG